MTSKTRSRLMLRQTERLVSWAISCVDAKRLLQIPPHGKHPHADKGFKTYFGEWPVLRQLYHLTFYEENYAIPAMRCCLGGQQPSLDLIFPRVELEDAAWNDQINRDISVNPMLDKLHGLRTVQIDIIREIPQRDWHKEEVKTGLGMVSAEFIVDKTIQHSLEHCNEILKNALYWERALDWLDCH